MTAVSIEQVPETRALVTEFRQRGASLARDAAEAERLAESLDLALKLHAGQEERAEGEPYVNHPLKVALAVIKDLQISDADVAIAALLHDAVEDQSARLVELLQSGRRSGDLRQDAIDSLSARFGPRVAALVDLLSVPDTREAAQRMKNGGDERLIRDIRRELYVEHVVSAVRADPMAFVIKWADFCSNALCLDRLPPGPQREYLRLRYRPVAEFFRAELGTLEDPAHPMIGHRYCALRALEEALNGCLAPA